MKFCPDCKSMQQKCDDLEKEIEMVKFQYKMKEKEVVKLLRFQHKEEQMAFRERLRQDIFDQQLKTMEEVVQASLKSILKSELDKRVIEIKNDSRD